jgi:predicted dehydrogenase
VSQAPPPVRVGIIGLGRMGRNHLRVLSLLKAAEIRFVFDTDGDTTDKLASLAGVPALASLDAGLGEVDAVIIASPTVTHADYVLQASDKIRNIFVEKPLADTATKAAQLAEVAERRGLNVQVGFIERFNPAVQQLKRVLDRSSAVVSMDLARTNKISGRITDVDVIADLMVHDIDLALYLNGPVADVSSHGVTRDGLIEYASAVLTHANGRFSRLVASRITEKKMRLIQATCRDLFVDCDLLRKEIVISRQSEVMQPEGEPYTITAMEETLEVPPHEALLLELQAFLASCAGEDLPGRPGAADGLAAAQICETIRSDIVGAG